MKQTPFMFKLFIADYQTFFRPKAFKYILFIKDRCLFPVLTLHIPVMLMGFRYLRSNRTTPKQIFMTHKPDISKYLWLSTDSRWKYTTSHRLVVLFIFIASILPAPNLCGQNIAIKSNLLYDLTTSLNLGGEIRCDDTHTLSLSVNYNPWSFGNNKKIKHFLIQPEYRKWFNEAFAQGALSVCSFTMDCSIPVGYFPLPTTDTKAIWQGSAFPAVTNG